MLKIIYIIVGLISTILGAIGTVFPVLPTTPFLLLALWCFTKSSQRFHDWFLGTTLYQKYLADYVEHRSMKRSTKIGLVSFATTIMLITIVLTDSLFVRIFLGAMILFLIWYFIFRIKTIE